jgi:hypothetical protein
MGGKVTFMHRLSIDFTGDSPDKTDLCSCEGLDIMTSLALPIAGHG